MIDFSEIQKDATHYSPDYKCFMKQNKDGSWMEWTGGAWLYCDPAEHFEKRFIIISRKQTEGETA